MRSLVLFAVFAVTACRDEQAGPKPRGARPPAAGQQQQQQAGPSGSVRTLDALPGALNFPSTATWANGAVKYLGSQVDPKNPQAGQPVTLKHYFRADGL